MVDKRKRLSEKPLHNNAGVRRRALLFRAIELIITFYKKKQEDKLAHFKKWEREKIVNLGLSDHPLSPNPSPAKDISFSSWDYEKVSNFGLSKPHVVKNFHRDKHLPREKQSDEKLTPKIAPAKAWKNDQNQTSFKNDKPVDDFFKILGYE